MSALDHEKRTKDEFEVRSFLAFVMDNVKTSINHKRRIQLFMHERSNSYHSNQCKAQDRVGRKGSQAMHEPTGHTLTSSSLDDQHRASPNNWESAYTQPRSFYSSFTAKHPCQYPYSFSSIPPSGNGHTSDHNDGRRCLFSIGLLAWNSD